MTITFFCPFCGKQTPDDVQICSRCGKSLEHWREYPYEERLLLVLHHPIREHRMMAIQSLGKQRYERAVPIFAKMIRQEDDVYLLREIARALLGINTEESRVLLDQLREHPSPVVKSAFDSTKSPRGGFS